MMSEQVAETVKNMLGPNVPIPKAFEPLYDAVRHKACINGGVELSTEMLALLLVLSQRAEPVPAETTAESDQPQKPDPLAVKFPKDTNVKVYDDNEVKEGVVVGIPYGKQKKYRVQVGGEAKPRYCDEDALVLME